MCEKKEFIERRPLLDKVYDADYYQDGRNKFMVVDELTVLDAPTAKVIETYRVKEVRESLLQKIENDIDTCKKLDEANLCCGTVKEYDKRIEMMETVKGWIISAFSALFDEDEDDD